MTKIIAISNHKGGVGKTTSTVNIGAGVALKGKKVLLIDLDPQANLTQCLGLIEPEKTIYGALRGEYDLPVIEVNNNLFLTPSTLDLASIEIELSTKIAREVILKKMIEKIAGGFDYIFIDCPPSLGLITVNAFAAANEIFIPLQAQFLALHGLDKLTDVIGLVRENLNTSLKVGGVFITQYDNRKVLNRDVLATIQEHFKDNIFKTQIRDNVALAEAPAQGLDIFRYNAKSYGADDYLALCKEIIKRK